MEIVQKAVLYYCTECGEKHIGYVAEEAYIELCKINNFGYHQDYGFIPLLFNVCSFCETFSPTSVK